MNGEGGIGAGSICSGMSAGRKEALAAYRRGALDEALAIQQQVVRAIPKPQAEDFLALCLILHARKELTAAVEVLREGLLVHPQHAQLHENLGTLLLLLRQNEAGIDALRHALALGSQSVNVYDGLCSGLGRLGRHEEALAFGRKSLEAKDARFGADAPLAEIPQAAPSRFDPAKREQNVISYVLWGDQPRYLQPLFENLRLRDHLFPGWTIRVYVDRSVIEPVQKALQGAGAQLVPREAPKNEPAARRLLWRFEVISDPSVKRFLVRDADSLLTVKERVAVDDWLRSPKYFHLMRDFRTHTDLMLAGMWGGVGGILPSPAKLWEQYKPWRAETDHIDQDLLTGTVWSTVRQSCLIHDSVFTGCLGSVPFPPYGELPAGHHVGQNAFIHFKQNK